jgi:radical SAM-linked protein
MRYRIRFSKLGKIRFTSHRDVARIWERALRRATVSVAYSEGFSPRPKLSFGLALSTGHESLGEYLDVESLGALDTEELPARLDPCLPVGFDVQAAAEVEPGIASLQQAVTSCTWRIEVTGVGEADLDARIERLLAADELVVTRERKGRPVTDDLRPAILSVSPAAQTAAGAEVVAELATQPRGLRPSELVSVVTDGDDALEEGRVCRLHQWVFVDGARREPLPLLSHATPTRHAEACAS